MIFPTVILPTGVIYFWILFLYWMFFYSEFGFTYFLKLKPGGNVDLVFNIQCGFRFIYSITVSTSSSSSSTENLLIELLTSILLHPFITRFAQLTSATSQVVRTFNNLLTYFYFHLSRIQPTTFVPRCVRFCSRYNCIRV